MSETRQVVVEVVGLLFLMGVELPIGDPGVGVGVGAGETAETAETGDDITEGERKDWLVPTDLSLEQDDWRLCFDPLGDLYLYLRPAWCGERDRTLHLLPSL